MSIKNHDLYDLRASVPNQPSICHTKQNNETDQITLEDEDIEIQFYNKTPKLNDLQQIARESMSLQKSQQKAIELDGFQDYQQEQHSQNDFSPNNASPVGDSSRVALNKDEQTPYKEEIVQSMTAFFPKNNQSVSH